MRIPVVLVVVALSLVVVASRRAEACSPAISGPHTVDEDEAALDSTAPVAGQPSFEIHRHQSSGCGDTCGDLATLRIDVPVTDDRADATGIGFDIEIIDGELTIEFPASAVRSTSSSTDTAALSFVWPSDVSESAIVRITPIDLAGNVGDPVTVEISDAGAGGGCQASGAGRRGAAGCLLFVIALLGMRRSGRGPGLKRI